MRIPTHVSEIWKPNGKPKPWRECPKDYEVGTIVKDSPFKKQLHLTRKCPKCETTWSYNYPWGHFSKEEMLEYKKYKEENQGYETEFALKKVKEILGGKYGKKDNSTNGEEIHE